MHLIRRPQNFNMTQSQKLCTKMTLCSDQHWTTGQKSVIKQRKLHRCKYRTKRLILFLSMNYNGDANSRIKRSTSVFFSHFSFFFLSSFLITVCYSHDVFCFAFTSHLMPLILAGAILKSTRNIYFWHELQAATIKSKQNKKRNTFKHAIEHFRSDLTKCMHISLSNHKTPSLPFHRLIKIAAKENDNGGNNAIKTAFCAHDSETFVSMFFLSFFSFLNWRRPHWFDFFFQCWHVTLFSDL